MASKVRNFLGLTCCIDIAVNVQRLPQVWPVKRAALVVLEQAGRWAYPGQSNLIVKPFVFRVLAAVF